MNRVTGWLLYQRILSRFVALYESGGYDISPIVYQQLKQCAREEVLRQALARAAESIAPADDGLELIRTRIIRREARR